MTREVYAARMDEGWIAASAELPKVGDKVWVLLAESPDADSGSKMGLATIEHPVGYPWAIEIDGADWYVRLWRRTQ